MQPQSYISCVICTHNPRASYLIRVLEALRAQSLTYEHWEVLLIDNDSSEALANHVDLSWHPNAQHIREDELGLTPARLRGIRESRGELLVFVDDDNVLAGNYLKEALRIEQEWPTLGAWGGSIKGEFEVEPAAWIRSYFSLRDECGAAIWSNDPDDWRVLPWGAGLCVRRIVAESYRAGVLLDPVRNALDRKGHSLLCHGDTDLVLTASGHGLGWGIFPQLQTTHLIPAFRATEDYLVRHTHDQAASQAMLLLCRGASVNARPIWRTIAKWLLIRTTRGRREARIFWAERQGAALGMRIALGLAETA